MLCIGYAKSVPDEGVCIRGERPLAFASRRHPLPQGERGERQLPLCAVAANQIETAPPFDHETRFMTDAPYISPLDQARILSEALPHMQRYDEETIVIKDGGQGDAHHGRSGLRDREGGRPRLRRRAGKGRSDAVEPANRL